MSNRSAQSEVSSASHEELLRCNNAHISLYGEFMRVKYELDAERYAWKPWITHILTSVIFRKLSARVLAIMGTQSMSQPPPMPPTSTYKMGPTTSSQTDLHSALEIPVSPSICDKDDYPAVRWWVEDSWDKYEAQQRDLSRPCKKLDFICDEDGVTISIDRLKVMTEMAKQLWNEMYHKRKDPSSWSKKLPATAQFFSNNMRSRFPEFRWCQDDWKVERFATIRFPDWCRNIRGSVKGLSRLFFVFFSVTQHS